jgi:hypothetical protein
VRDNNYKINKVDVSQFIIRGVFEVDEDNVAEWYEDGPDKYFDKYIFSQVGSIRIDGLIGFSFQNPVFLDNEFYPGFVFHGSDKKFLDEVDDSEIASHPARVHELIF